MDSNPQIFAEDEYRSQYEGAPDAFLDNILPCLDGMYETFPESNALAVGVRLTRDRPSHFRCSDDDTLIRPAQLEVPPPKISQINDVVEGLENGQVTSTSSDRGRRFPRSPKRAPSQRPGEDVRTRRSDLCQCLRQRHGPVSGPTLRGTSRTTPKSVRSVDRAQRSTRSKEPDPFSHQCKERVLQSRSAPH